MTIKLTFLVTSLNQSFLCFMSFALSMGSACFWAERNMEYNINAFVMKNTISAGLREYANLTLEAI